MNREIKFRGRRLDNGEWVYGYYYCECGNTYIIEDRQKVRMTMRNIPFLVDPDTISQFTGLYDCNGKEIYEGDIVRAKSQGECRICVVTWSKPLCKFFLRYTSGWWNISADEKDTETFEVIGNIYDNPDLLKGE